MTTSRIHLSPPDVGADEREMLLAAFDSNWIAPVGPDLEHFEREVAEIVGVGHAVALSSGTAALQTTLVALGIGPGDTVLVQDFTFAATAFAVAHTGAEPVFVDSEQRTWNIDPEVVERAITELSLTGRRPRAVVTVDLYGRCADYAALVEVCERHGVLLVEDAAEALGSTTVVDGDTRAAGSFGVAAVLSFNGNKIVTTGGGGMMLTGDAALADRVRHLSTQARQPVSHYEHRELGFNHRLSNLLAAVGRGQIRHLDDKVRRRRAINSEYRRRLADLPGVTFDPFDSGSNCWLSCILVDPARTDGVDRWEVEQRLAEHDIESRPVWMPMHLQPVFAGAQAYRTGVGAHLFAHGLCLPSGSGLTAEQLDTVIAHVRSCWERS